MYHTDVPVLLYCYAYVLSVSVPLVSYEYELVVSASTYRYVGPSFLYDSQGEGSTSATNYQERHFCHELPGMTLMKMEV